MNKIIKGLMFILLNWILISCSGNSSNIYILADTSMPDESVEEEFCKKTGQDNYPIINYDKE